MLLRITTVEIPVNRPYSVRAGRKRPSGAPEKKSRRLEAVDIQGALYCRVCGKAITTKEQAIKVNASFCHTFFNPAGIVFELGCYKKAPGCITVGVPSSEFSWFAGHRWSFALCSACETHLGWYFDSGGSTFWGLILNTLKE